MEKSLRENVQDQESRGGAKIDRLALKEGTGGGIPVWGGQRCNIKK